MFLLALILIGCGLAVLVFGSRMAVLGAGVGALLGVGLLRLLPGVQEGFLWLLVPVGLAILGAVGTGFMKGMVNIVMLVLGVLAGAAIVLGLLDMFGLNFGLFDWVLAIIGGVIGAIVVKRFAGWAVIVIAALVGALLTMRGLQLLLPSLQGPIATLLALVLAGGGIAYHGGWIGQRQGAAPQKQG
jgi:hypothetical protein